MKIEILGTGCPKCKKLEENVRAAIKDAKIEAEVVKVTEIDKIMEYGVMLTPALAIDGKVVATGRLLNPNDIKNLISKVGG